MILLFSLFFNITIASEDVTYNQILINKPNIDKIYARKLALLINKTAIKHDFSPKLYAAILMQESAYNVKRIAKTTGIHNGIEQSVETDFGISQIHYKTIKRYKFNRQKLTNNLEYSIEAGGKVLGDFKRKFKHEKHWYLRYNVGTGKQALKSTHAKIYCERLNIYGKQCKI